MNKDQTVDAVEGEGEGAIGAEVVSDVEEDTEIGVAVAAEVAVGTVTTGEWVEEVAEVAVAAEEAEPGKINNNNNNRVKVHQRPVEGEGLKEVNLTLVEEVEAVIVVPHKRLPLQQLSVVGNITKMAVTTNLHQSPSDKARVVVVVVVVVLWLVVTVAMVVKVEVWEAHMMQRERQTLPLLKREVRNRQPSRTLVL